MGLAGLMWLQEAVALASGRGPGPGWFEVDNAAQKVQPAQPGSQSPGLSSKSLPAEPTCRPCCGQVDVSSTVGGDVRSTGKEEMDVGRCKTAGQAGQTEQGPPEFTVMTYLQ